MQLKNNNTPNYNDFKHKGIHLFVCCRAEIECQAYRKMAAQKEISLDDTDEEWAEQGKENEENRISNSNIQT